MKWIYKTIDHTKSQTKYNYFVRCPYCRHAWLSMIKDNICPRCKAIFTEELYIALSGLSRKLSKELKG